MWKVSDDHASEKEFGKFQVGSVPMAWMEQICWYPYFWYLIPALYLYLVGPDWHLIFEFLSYGMLDC